MKTFWFLPLILPACQAVAYYYEPVRHHSSQLRLQARTFYDAPVISKYDRLERRAEAEFYRREIDGLKYHLHRRGKGLDNITEKLAKAKGAAGLRLQRGWNRLSGNRNRNQSHTTVRPSSSGSNHVGGSVHSTNVHDSNQHGGNVPGSKYGHASTPNLHAGTPSNAGRRQGQKFPPRLQSLPGYQNTQQGKTQGGPSRNSGSHSSGSNRLSRMSDSSSAASVLDSPTHIGTPLSPPPRINQGTHGKGQSRPQSQHSESSHVSSSGSINDNQLKRMTMGQIFGQGQTHEQGKPAHSN